MPEPVQPVPPAVVRAPRRAVAAIDAPPTPIPPASVPVQPTRSVAIGHLVVQGSDAANVRRRLQRSIDTFERCYDAALASDPGITGSLVARFTIAANGRVATVVVNGFPEVHTCVATAVRHVVFPASATGAVVEAPIELTVATP